MEGGGFKTLSSIESERVDLLKQRRKAYVLIFMMIMLAQTSYIGAMQGWTYLQDNDVNATGASCSSITRTSGTPIYVDAVNGSDDWDGTWSCPKATLSDALNDSVSDDEIILYSGRYHENVTVDNKDNLLIRAADGARVVFDGTRSITEDLGGVWGTADSDGIQEVTLSEDGWQLFLAYEEQVPARWPNAQFSDETVFNRSYWAEGTLTGSNNAYTQGWLTDAGPETGVHSGLNETINATGLDPVGAIAVMNLGSFRSNSREITDWYSANGTFAYDGTGVGWKTKHHAYFLEGKRELIDVDGEWWFDNANNELHYKTPSGQNANDLDLRVKVQPFAIGVENSDGVTIQGIDFYGTTVNFNECDGCSFTNSTLEYPSTSKRGLGIAGESEDDRWMTRFYRSTNSFVDNISITNTDGGAIEFQGSAGQSNNNTVNNSYFHAIDWSAADQKGLMTTIYEGGRDMYFMNNTVHLTGASSVLSIGDSPTVLYNEVWDVGHLQTDGAVVQIMQGEAPGAEIAYNWIHDIIKYGVRFDAPIGQVGTGQNGTMHHNVVWNAAGGLMVKGDYHDIHNNTVFNSTLDKNDIIALTDGDINNKNSTFHRNAVDSMADHRSDSWSLYPLPSGTYWDNWNGYVNVTDTVSNQLVDPINSDFRPKTNSHLDNMSAGAYDADDSDPWTAGISWTYTTPDAPVEGCMLDYADNYDADATLSDGSCSFASYTPPSTLDLRLHLDPTNSSSYSGSGTNVADLSGFDNDGTVAAAGPTWDGDFTRFSYDGACTGSTPNLVCDEIEVSDSTSLRPGGNDWSVSVWFNASTHQHSVILGAFDDGGAAVDVGWAIRMRASGGIYANVGTTSNNSAAWTSEASIDTDRWYHVVLVADPGNTLRLYVDGQNVGSGSLSGSGALRNVSNSLFIASYNGGEYSQTFDGQVGSVMAFADALNATTINQIYNASKGVYSNTTTLSFPQSSPTLLLGQTYSFPMTVANGEITTSYSLTGTLPSGMNFESSNGTIWGTPTAAMSTTSYTVTANNSAGTYSTSFSLTSQHAAPYDLAYAPENMTLEKGTAMTTNTPSVSGGAITSWEINPSVPTGLSFSTSTGAISGTPYVLQTTATTYTIWANNSGGNASAQVNITINDEVPIISYSYDDITGTKSVAISPHSGPTTSGGTITSWEISPSPGSAFHFNSANGYISGTPGILLARTQYTIWANNSGGSSVAYVNVTINDAAPNALGYSPENMTLEKDTAMTPNLPSVSGGTITSWEISPSLPSGLTWGASDGKISGTPAVLQTTTVTYTIWANNSGGSDSAQVNITINDQLASATYPSTVEVSNDRAMTTVSPTVTGGAVTSWVIVPSLSSGLNFGSSNGSIWGTPTGLLENATYTVYANNSGGSTSITFTLGLNWTLTPSAEGAFITRNSSIASDITWEWDYDPLEAQNLSLVTGEWNTCALDSNQNVFCWGRNGNGQIGNGQTGTSGCGTSGHKCKDIPTATNDLGSDVISLAFGHQHACGLLDTGAVKCWGRNNAGQLGTSGGDKDTPQTINLGSGRTATSIYAGGHYTCAILDDASVKCWGENGNGQLGIGSNSNANTPTTINTLGSGRTAISLATAMSAVCALLDDGSVKCWGASANGQLGNGGTSSNLKSPPASAINLGTGRTAKAITGGESHFCAILDDDSIKCWGNGFNGKLGTGTTSHRSTPTSTSGSFATGRYAVAIDAGYDHTCAILDNGQLTCWGSDSDGQLGNGATTGTKSSIQSTTVTLGSGRTAISLSAGGEHTCAQLDNGQLKCWGNRADGQVGDNGNFNNPSDRTSPSSVSNNNHGGYTYLNTGVMPSSAVTGATCEISPSLPTGLSLTAGTCTITGTPTATASNATYTIWANVSGTSYSGQIWLEVGLNAPDISYSSSTYTYTKDIEIFTLNPTNVGGEVTTWAINATLPSGLTFETSNGTIWGTPDTITASTTYTVWANNSADSDSFTITFTVNDATPNFYYGSASGGGAHTLVLYLDQTMNPLTPTQASGGGAITSCSSSPSLPSGLSLSSTCVLSGTPDATATGAFYTITGTNTGGSDTASLYIEIRSYGGTLSVTPSNTEGSVNSSISDITMSYAHQISNYGWTSGVSNTTTTLSNNFLTAGGTHLLGIDSGDQGEMVVVYAHNDTSSASGTYSLAMMYRWGGTWTETILDTGTDTGYHPSVAIDRQGAIHIAYIDDHNDELRYATNASGSWVFTTLGSSTYDNDDGRGTAIVVHPITDAVHIVTTINDNTYRDLQYHTNESGSWVNETITNTLSDEGHDPAMAMDGDGNLHVAYYCDDGCSDLRMSSRINGVWQNETVASTLNIGNDPDIAIDSQGTIHIVSQYLNTKRIYLHSGTPGSWTEQTGLSGGNAHWPVVSVDSNDAVHISYHFGNTQKDVMYMTNASGSWSTASMIEGYGGWGSEMVIDANDDIFIPNVAPGITEIQLTTVKGSGQGLTARPTYDIAPMLPDGLIMNWRNGTISGTPTEALANTTFTVTVTALGATTTTGTFTLYIPDAPGPFEYNPENNTLTKNTEVHLAPQFLNQTTGNGSAWRVADINSGSTGSDPGKGMSIVVGNVLYFGADDGSNGIELWAYNTSNTTTWLVEDIRPGSSSSNPGSNMMQVINGVLYFNAVDGSTGQELWKHDPSTGTTSRVYDLNSGSSGSSIGLRMSMVVGDVLYFSANDGSTGHELWAYNTSNSSNPWQVMDINSGSGSSDPGTYLENVVGDTLYFSALGVTSVGASNGIELWAHNTSNLTTWEVANINYWYQQGYPGMYLDIVVGDTLYFSATDGTDGHELWAHNTSNESTWQVADIANGATDSKPGDSMAILIGDTIYFDADDGNTGIELWAHDTSNHSTWQVADINSGASDSDVGEYMSVSIGNTLLFSAEDGTNGRELWAHDTLNGTTWMTSDMGTYTIPGYKMAIVAGDTLFFDDGGSEPYAYSTSNATTWRIADINSGSSASYPGWYMSALIGDTLYFDAEDGSTGKELWAFAINGVNFMTNTGGIVTSYEINASLPSGLSFGTSNGTIWGIPTVLQTTATTYTVWANNSGGSSVAYLNITIVDELPTLSYSPSTLVLTKGNQSSDLPLNATLTGSGTITSWAINATLPAGLNFGTSNGTIWGIPTVLQTTATTYTVWANNSGGSSSATVTITINDEAPGPFEYNPENNTLTNNTYVHLEPDFINITTGNGSSWSTPAGTFHPFADAHGRPCLSYIHNGTLYTAATSGTGTTTYLYGFGLSNSTAWVVNSTVISPGCKLQSFGMAGSSFVKTLAMSYGTSLYFEAKEGTWEGLFGYGLENGTLWRESSDELEIGSDFTAHFEDIFYFGAYFNSSVGVALHAHNLSNGTTWLVMDASSGSTIPTVGSTQTDSRANAVGDVFFYPTYINSNYVYWAYNTSNGSTWAISSNAYEAGCVLDGVFYYESGLSFNSRRLHAYNASNETSWQVHTQYGVSTISELGGVLYYAARSTTSPGNYDDSLWAHNPKNGTTWEISSSVGDVRGDFLYAGGTLFYQFYTGNLSALELWAYQPSNATAWQIADAGLNGDVFTSLGNTVYFTSETNPISTVHDLWAYNTANETTWFVTNISASNWGWTYSGGVGHPEVTSLIFAGNTLYIREGGGMRSHQPASINYQTNTGGPVTSWAINASLPSGLSFSTTNGSIYGTPTELWTQTSYMVWANNSGGSTVAYLNITVVDELPTLSYSPENLTLTKNQTSTDLPLTATVTGSGTITSWAISPVLPSGLSFGTSNGTIWGTPTVLQTSPVTYTVWANNSGGSSSATVNITVNDEAPDISYNPDWFVLTNNTAMSPIATPTNSGGAIPSTVIDSTGNVGEDTSIAIDSNGNRHISYYDETGSDLKYATDKTGSWVTVSVDTTGFVGTDSSIAIDSNDAVHISYYDYTNSDLKYATCSSGCTIASNWDDVSVDTTGFVGTDSSIAIDSNDAVHISYYDYTNSDLKYATCSSGCTTASNWDDVSVETTGVVGSFTSIAIDSNDAVHISYYDSTNRDLEYATCSSGCTTASNWITTSVETTGVVGYYTSIAIDSTDAVHISYFDNTNDDLKYATCSSGCTTASNWVDVSVDITGHVGRYTSISIDSNDNAHISYYDTTNSDLKYATCSSGCTTASNWDKVSVDTSGSVGYYTSIAIDSSDTIHISYFDNTNDDLKYVVLDSSSNMYGYSISPDLPAGLSLNFTSGEISGTPTALSTNTTYTITVRNSGGVNTTTITIEVLDQLPTIAYSPENLTLTKNQTSTDLPLTATVMGSGTITSWAISPALPSGLSFGTSNGTIWGTPTSMMTLKTFTISASNSGGSVNATVNITVNDEAPDISYSPDWFELTKGVAMSPTATPINAGGAIPTSILESTGEVGRGTSLAIDANGYKHVTYFDDTNYVLKYATDASGSWVNITLNTITYHQQSSSSSIVIDSGGVLHIAYTGTSGNLTYATCSSTCTSNASWTFVEIDDSGSASGSPSLAIDSNNTMHISYIEYNVGTTPETLKYATCSASCTTASSWSNITVDNSFNTANHADIAIDSNDGLHISYYKQTYSESWLLLCHLYIFMQRNIIMEHVRSWWWRRFIWIKSEFNCC